MAKPKTKAELIEAATTNYENLLEMIANRTEEEKSREYDFSGDDRKKGSPLAKGQESARRFDASLRMASAALELAEESR